MSYEKFLERQLPRNIDQSGILNLMRSGGQFARYFDEGPKASLTDPIKMFRGEA